MIDQSDAITQAEGEQAQDVDDESKQAEDSSISVSSRKSDYLK
jgi:hypothetical protein